MQIPVVLIFFTYVQRCHKNENLQFWGSKAIATIIMMVRAHYDCFKRINRLHKAQIWVNILSHFTFLRFLQFFTFFIHFLISVHVSSHTHIQRLRNKNITRCWLCFNSLVGLISNLGPSLLKNFGGQTLLFAFRWRHRVHSTLVRPSVKLAKWGHIMELIYFGEHGPP